MPQKKIKNICIYIFLFLIIGTLNNKSLIDSRFAKVDEIIVLGLDENNNKKIIENLKQLSLGNLFFLDKFSIREIILSNNQVENFSVFKKYPSSIKIEIDKTKFIAQIIKDKNYFLLGQNQKLIQIEKLKKNIPIILGDFDNKNLIDLKKIFDESNFDFFKIKKLFFFFFYKKNFFKKKKKINKI